jgi:hypothetical protein
MARADQDFSGIRVSAVDWPIVLIDFPAHGVSDATIQALLGHIESIMTEAARSREKLFVINDLTRVREMSPASQRQYTADWVKHTSALARAASVGAGHVTPSPLLRLILSAVFWISPAPTPSIFVATRREAMIRGIQLLESQRAPLSPRLVAYRDRRSKRGGLVRGRDEAPARSPP